MRINHLATQRSRFHPLITAALRAAGHAFPARPVSCDLGPPKAYSGDIHITVSTGSDFDADWESPDITRFPHRIRAAATSLRDCGFHGRFRVTHHDGIVTITQA